MATKLSRFALIVALVAFTSACALTLRSPSIADLKSHPGRYQDRSVSVSGVVTSSWACHRSRVPMAKWTPGPVS